MCGIHVEISASIPRNIPDNLKRRLCSRGPDHCSTLHTHLDNDASAIHIAFTSTVLALRGDSVTRQPFVDVHSGSTLCWNGEAWRIRQRRVSGNDGETIFRLLREEALRCRPAASEAGILSVLRSVDGPFAFVFLHKLANKIYFGRDRLGRRSLLIHSDSQQLVLSSVAAAPHPLWQEVEADGIYVLDMAKLQIQDKSVAQPLPLTRLDWVPGVDPLDFVSGIGMFNDALPGQETQSAYGSDSVVALRQHLVESLSLRVQDVPSPPGPDETPSRPRVAILFSGGLDCTVIARVCHEILPSDQEIDLVNVAFENPRVVAAAAAAAQAKNSRSQENIKPFDTYEACPDRMTGRKSFAELQALCPGRAWRFLAVDVAYSEYLSHKSEVISLIYPQNTEMDLSIACAFYFAARGQGTTASTGAAASPPSPVFYNTPARVLLSGLGADELFGGYQRHATAFQRQGYLGLMQELKLDVSRLGKRNLGRDDRVTSHWGKEVRFPFLDEVLVRWAIGTPVCQKCNFGKPDAQFEPGKRILRLLASDLGMAGVATEKKRAIQFGARTAKMESGKLRGTTLLS